MFKPEHRKETRSYAKAPIELRREDFSPASAQESPSESIAAPAEVGQGLGTPTLEQFQRWLETRAHEANAAFDGEPLHGDDMATHQWRCALMVNSCRTATSLLMHFKLEQGS